MPSPNPSRQALFKSHAQAVQTAHEALNSKRGAVSSNADSSQLDILAIRDHKNPKAVASQDPLPRKPAPDPLPYRLLCPI